MIKGTRKLISGALTSVDIFEDPIHLNMKGETALTSSLGGFLSVLIIIFLGVQAIIQSISMFNRNDPQIIQMNEFEDDPGPVYLNNSNNFVMAVAITVDNKNLNLSSNSIVSFTSTYSQYIRSTDGSQKKYKSSIYWASCTEADFPNTVFPDKTFATYSLAYAYRPTYINFTDSNTGTCEDSIKEIYPDCRTPPNFDILGTFLSLDFEFIQFKLLPCTQSHSTYIADLQCANDTSIDSIFGTKETTMNLYYSNTLIDPVNYETPNKTYLDTIYWNVHPNVSTVADIFVDTETVQDFNDYFLTDEHTNKTFYSIQRESTRELQKFQASSLLEWNLRRSNLNHLTSRTYTKVLDVVSNVGGMSEFFMIIGAIIAVGYARYKYQMILSNELYDFQPLEEAKSPQIESPRSPGSPLIELSRSDREESINPSNPGTPVKKKQASFFKAMSSKRKANPYSNNTIKDYFELQKKKKRILNYNEFSYFKSLLKGLFCRRDKEEIMAQKARQQVIQDLDIIKVVEKLKEIDKLKMLLLNANQRKTFEFIEKPLITLDSDKPLQAGSMSRIGGYTSVALAKGVALNGNQSHQNKISDQNDQDTLSEYAKIYMAYRGLKDDHDLENVRYNTKLLEMIDENLKVVFRRVDQLMGSEPDPARFEAIITKILEPQPQPQPQDLSASITSNERIYLQV